jgi:hypothetical protein
LKPNFQEINLSEGTHDVVIKIKSPVSRRQETLLVAWIAAFTLCGIAVVYYLITETFEEKARLALWIYLGFWIYFEYHLLFALLWLKYGCEKIRFADGVVEVKNEIAGYGKVNRYFWENIKNPVLIKHHPASWAGSLQNSFWFVGGERLQFEYLGQKVVLGRKISRESAAWLLAKLEKHR